MFWQSAARIGTRQLAIIALVLGAVAVVSLGVIVWRRRARPEWLSDKTSLVDLAEFETLDPEIKDLYTEAMVKKMMPITLRKSNRAWQKMPKSVRDRARKRLVRNAETLANQWAFDENTLMDLVGVQSGQGV